MDMSDPEKNWDKRVAAARRLAAPTDIDVRWAVRRAIEAERSLGSKETGGRNLWSEVTDLAGATWLRGLLGGGLLAAIPLGAAAISAARELLEAARLASPTLLGF
jgi:hypothetical protein